MAGYGATRPRPQASGYGAGIFESLLNFSFDRFATPKLIRILYVLTFVTVCGIGAIFFLTGLLSDSGLVVFATLIAVPVVTVLMLIYARVMMELLSVMFTISENTGRAVTLLERRAGHDQPGSPAPGDGPDDGRGAGRARAHEATPSAGARPSEGARAEPDRQSSRRGCAECGWALDARTKFCPGCGTAQVPG